MVNICQRNQLSNTGRNIQYLENQYEVDSLKDLIRKKQVIKKLRVNPLEDGEEWKVQIIEELSLCRRGCLEIDLKDVDIDAMLEAIATD